MHLLRGALPIVFAIAASLLLQPATASSTAEAQPISQLRVVHALAGAPPVDLFIDGVRVINGLAFGVVGPYLNLAAGPHALAVVPSGAVVASALLTTEWELAPGQPYTVLVTAPQAAAPVPLLLQDTRFAVLGGAPRVRFVHASPDAPAVDVALAGGPVLFSNLGFGDATPYLDIPTGTVTLELRATGTPTVVLAIPDAVLTVGTVYTFGMVGLVGGVPPLGPLPLVDS